MAIGRELPSEDVKRIRHDLEYSREELAEVMNLSPDAIKSWEEGQRTCKGPSRLLLLLLEKNPRLMESLEDRPGRLPNTEPIEGSEEWFKLQRLLGIIGYPDWNHWSAIYVEEELAEEWLWEIEHLNLVHRHPRNPKIRCVSEIGMRKYKLQAWRKWWETLECEDTRNIPIMTNRLLKQYGS